MNFLIIALLSQATLNYIIHFQKVGLPSKVKLIDGAESAFLYVDTNNTIRRMEFTQTDMHELYPIDPGFDVNSLGLKNSNAEQYGNGHYLAAGTNDLLMISLINSAHQNISAHET